MQEGKPSRTADRVAGRRAAHQVLDQPPVFEDPLALRIIDAAALAEIRANPALHNVLPARNLRAFVAVRSRFAEDALAEAVWRGVRQYVVLGAGLDTFAFRNRFEGQGLKVFEVDHPATQIWKRQRLAAAGIEIPESVRFAPIDFEKQKLSDALANAGFDADRPAFFGWLGVVPYLTREAFEETAGFIGSIGGEVVFDYGVDRSLLNPLEQAGLDALSRRVAKAGEPFRLLLLPEELARTLEGFGFNSIEDVGSRVLNGRYFAGRTDGLGLTGRVARIMHARASKTALPRATSTTGGPMNRLADVFDGWNGYQTSLVHAIEPLTAEQLAWKPSEKVRSVGELARHIALGRVNWFMRMQAPGSAKLAGRIQAWDHDPHGNAYIIEMAVAIQTDAAALAGWLNDTWSMIEQTLNAWTVDDLAKTYRHVWRGDAYDVSRQWTIWRIMAHDIHHGGQIARVLAERGIEAFELRGLGGHIVSPAKAK